MSGAMTTGGPAGVAGRDYSAESSAALVARNVRSQRGPKRAKKTVGQLELFPPEPKPDMIKPSAHLPRGASNPQWRRVVTWALRERINAMAKRALRNLIHHIYRSQTGELHELAPHWHNVKCRLMTYSKWPEKEDIRAVQKAIENASADPGEHEQDAVWNARWQLDMVLKLQELDIVLREGPRRTRLERYQAKLYEWSLLEWTSGSKPNTGQAISQIAALQPEYALRQDVF